jgi:hypothetical protein
LGSWRYDEVESAHKVWRFLVHKKRYDCVFIRRHLGPFKLHLECATAGSWVVRNAALEFGLAPIYFEARIKMGVPYLHAPFKYEYARTRGEAQCRRGSRYNWEIKIIENHVIYGEQITIGLLYITHYGDHLFLTRRFHEKSIMMISPGVRVLGP